MTNPASRESSITIREELSERIQRIAGKKSLNPEDKRHWLFFTRQKNEETQNIILIYLNSRNNRSYLLHCSVRGRVYEKQRATDL